MRFLGVFCLLVVLAVSHSVLGECRRCGTAETGLEEVVQGGTPGRAVKLSMLAGKVPAPILLCEVVNNRIAIYSKEGKRIWQYSINKPVDVWPTASGTILITFNGSKATNGMGGIREISQSGKTLFEYFTKGEVMSCQPLENGNFLVAENTVGRITEVDRSGSIVNEFDVKTKGMGHETVRHIRKTFDGNILSCEKYAHVVREYAADGAVVREIKTKYPFTAQKLTNGNILVAHYHVPRILEYDTAGNVIWKVTAEDLPAELNIKHLCEVIRLDDGSTMVANAVKKGDADAVTVFAVSPDKKVIWSLSDRHNTSEVTAAKPLPDGWLNIK